MATSELQDAVTLLDEGKPDEAIPALKHVAGQTPAHVVPYALLAQAYETLEQWQEALDAWQQAYVLMPNSPVIAEGLQRTMDRFPTPSREALDSDVDVSTPTHPSSEVQETEEDLVEEATSAPPSTLSSTDVTETIEDEPPPDHPPADVTDEPEDELSPEALLEQLSGPGGHPPAQTGAADVDDLDRLIEELEDARIAPDPDVDDDTPLELEDDIDDMVSETLARIYASQKQYQEAARVYEQLAAQQPDKSDTFLQKAAEMRERAQGGDTSDES